MSDHVYSRDVEALVTLSKWVGVIDTGVIGEEAEKLWKDCKELLPEDILAQCQQVLKWLQGKGFRVVADVNISMLLDAIDGWEQVEVSYYKNANVNFENDLINFV